MLRSKHAGQWEELGSQEKSSEPRLPTELGHQGGSELQGPKKEEDDTLVSPELCLHRADVYALVDTKGRPHTGLLCPKEENPPSPFHPSLPGTGPSSGQERGGYEEEDRAFHFLPVSSSSVHPKY